MVVKIVGLSFPPALATEVKIEVARRNVSLEDLFGKMWAPYKNNTKRSA